MPQSPNDHRCEQAGEYSLCWCSCCGCMQKVVKLCILEDFRKKRKKMKEGRQPLGGNTVVTKAHAIDWCRLLTDSSCNDIRFPKTSSGRLAKFLLLRCLPCENAGWLPSLLYSRTLSCAGQVHLCMSVRATRGKCGPLCATGRHKYGEPGVGA